MSEIRIDEGISLRKGTTVVVLSMEYAHALDLAQRLAVEEDLEHWRSFPYDPGDDVIRFGHVTGLYVPEFDVDGNPLTVSERIDVLAKAVRLLRPRVDVVQYLPRENPQLENPQKETQK